MKKIFFLLALLVASASFATNYYVSSEYGKASNDGLSTLTAKNDIQETGLLTKPGDTVFVMNGVYTKSNYNDNIVNIYNSGTPNNWIVYTNYPNHSPIIKSQNISAIEIQGADYIEISGFEVIGNADSISLSYAISQQNIINNPLTRGYGIGCRRQSSNPLNYSHHITIKNCKVYKCPGCGIYSSRGDYIKIQNNIVAYCSWYSPLSNSGIALYQQWNSDSSKEIKNFIVGNICYGNKNDIPFYTLGTIVDGNGIIIDDFRNTQNGSTLGKYLGKTYVGNNLVYNNGGRGIQCFLSDNVIIVNNTCYKNCQSPAIKEAEICAGLADNITIINNIASPDINIPPINFSDANNLVVSHNLWASNATIATPFGTNTVVGEAKFVYPSSNPLFADFHLQIGSSAINTGTTFFAPDTDKDGISRVAPNPIDIGCYEYFPKNQTMDSLVKKTNYSLFPNPSLNSISLQFHETIVYEALLEVYDKSGQKLISTNSKSSNGTITLDISKISDGTYFIIANDKEGKVLMQSKFIKARK